MSLRKKEKGPNTKEGKIGRSVRPFRSKLCVKKVRGKATCRFIPLWEKPERRTWGIEVKKLQKGRRGETHCLFSGRRKPGRRGKGAGRGPKEENGLKGKQGGNGTPPTRKVYKKKTRVVRRRERCGF